MSLTWSAATSPWSAYTEPWSGLDDAGPSLTIWSAATSPWSAYPIPWSGAAAGAFICDADAGGEVTGRALAGALHFNADAGGRVYGRATAFWQCDAEASGTVSGRVTEWHVSGLEFAADATGTVAGYPVGAGILRFHADAGGEIWPRLRAIPEACLGAHTEPETAEDAPIGNYVF